MTLLPVVTDIKFCKNCSRTKPLADFNRFYRTPDGLQAWCRACMNGIAAQWQRDHPERQRGHERRCRARKAGRSA